MAVEDQRVTDNYSVFLGDSCEVLPKLPDESIHFSIYSPPFALKEGGGCLYHYSSSIRDLSNARTYDEFFDHYAFIVKEVHRLTLPGRITAVHCTDIPKKGANICGYNDFPGDIIRLHESLGFEYLPRICIWKEPLGVRNRTMAKSLYHIQIVEDSTLVNVACADYLIPFRKKGVNPIPVTHDNGFMEYHGERQIPPDVLKFRGYKGNQIENRYSHWIWRQYASCFWDDIRLSNVLPYKEARDEEDEKHVHPLQLDVINRSLALWTNPGEVVLSPFAGVGSEPYCAVRAGRKALGVELKPSYFRQMVKNLEAKDEPKPKQVTLFDAIQDMKQKASNG